MVYIFQLADSSARVRSLGRQMSKVPEAQPPTWLEFLGFNQQKMVI